MPGVNSPELTGSVLCRRALARVRPGDGECDDCHSFVLVVVSSWRSNETAGPSPSGHSSLFAPKLATRRYEKYKETAGIAVLTRADYEESRIVVKSPVRERRGNARFMDKGLLQHQARARRSAWNREF